MLGARSDKALDDVVEDIRSAGGQAVAVATDVTSRADVAALVATAEAEFGGLDVLVNNAGVGPVSALDELKVDEWDRMVDVNLKGVLDDHAPACGNLSKHCSTPPSGTHRTRPDSGVSVLAPMACGDS